MAYTTVDVEDYEILMRYRWYLAKGYVARKARGDGRERFNVSMHRQILGLQLGEEGEVDHDNRNPLDNRRSNLICADHTHNMMNVGSNRNATSQYGGVSWNKQLKKWVASFRGKHIGTFTDELEAARAAQARREQG